MSYGKKVINFVREILRKYGSGLARSKAKLKASEHIYKLMFEFYNET
jgi:hypothetical protein